MTISLIAIASMTGWAFFGMLVAHGLRRQRIESRMGRALRLAFLS